MNINDYISSGILEQYVLGDISPQEKKEVECMSHIYPELQEELLKCKLHSKVLLWIMQLKFHLI